MLKALAFAMAFASFSVAVCLAQSAVSPAEKIAAIAVWLRTPESRSKIEDLGNEVARNLGYEHAMKMRCAKYGDKGMAIFFCSLPVQSDILLARRDVEIDRMVYWLFKSGEPSKIVMMKSNNVSVVDGDIYRRGREVTLDFFYKHLPQNSSTNERSTSGFGDADK